MVNMILGDLKRLYGYSKEHTISHVALPLKGVFKGEIETLYHCVMIAEKTRSGIIIQPWDARVISYWEGIVLQAGLYSEVRRKKEIKEENTD